MAVSEIKFSFQNRLAHLLASVGERRFWPTLAAFLREDINFDSWVVMIFNANDAPQIVYEGDSDLQADALFVEYLSDSYKNDPFYLFSRTNSTPGLYRLNQIAPEYFKETDYFKSYFSPNVGQDEVQFLFPLSTTRSVSLSLGRHSLFSEIEMECLYAYSPWILSLLAKTLRIEESLGEGNLNATMEIVHSGGRNMLNTSFLANVLIKNANWNLTARESETLGLMLSGHQAKEIAKTMKISPATVKVHKRNIYQKLSVNNQSQILDRCLTFLRNFV